MATRFVSNRQIYEEAILKIVPGARKRLWIATADIKDMYVEKPGFRPDGIAKSSGDGFAMHYEKGEADGYEGCTRSGTPRINGCFVLSQGAQRRAGNFGSAVKMVPFLQILAELLRRGIEIRLIHAKEPGPAFRQDFDRFPGLWGGIERVLCPRVHFKCIIADGVRAYFGSANLTGAGMGAKGENRRNFENGVLTNDPALVEPLAEQFDSVWLGAYCSKCGRRQYCTDCPI